MDIYVIILLAKPIECTTPGVNPKVNYGLWMNYEVSMYVHPWLKIYHSDE